jgi:putative oxidoreductase
MARLDSMTALVGRLCLSAIFLVSGAGKLMSPTAVVAEIGATGLPMPWIGFAAAVAIELLGGLALVTGYAARPAAVVLAVFTMVAGSIFHSHFADQNQFTHFLKNVAITGGLLQVVVLERITLEKRT